MKKVLSLCRHDFQIHKQAFFIIGLLLIVFLLRFPSLFEPYWYGDEGIYQVVGRALRSGRLLYQGIWDNKPPILYLLYALVNGNLFSIRLLSIITAMTTVIAFLFLGQTLFKKKMSFYIATIIFALSLALPILEGNIANAENFMLLPIVIAGLITFMLGSHQKLFFPNVIFNRPYLSAFIVGILLSLAFLIKTVAIFDLAAFLLFLGFVYPWQNKKRIRELKDFGRKTFPIITGFILPIVFTFLILIYQGVFADFLTAVFAQSVSYISFGNQFITPWGFLIFKLLLLFWFLVFLFWQRDRFTKTQIFIMLWFGFSLFNAFFAQRPYTHYLLVVLPSFCLLIGETIESKQYRFIGFLLLIFTLSLIPRNFWIYDKIIPYYQNFTLFVNGQRNTDEYRTFFDESIPSYYEVARFIATHTKKEDVVFIWGNAAQTYVLAGKLPPGRLIVSYHITFYEDALKETVLAIKTSRPKYIILLLPMGNNAGFLKDYGLRFILSKGIAIYERSL